MAVAAANGVGGGCHAVAQRLGALHAPSPGGWSVSRWRPPRPCRRRSCPWSRCRRSPRRRISRRRRSSTACCRRRARPRGAAARAGRATGCAGDAAEAGSDACRAGLAGGSEAVGSGCATGHSGATARGGGGSAGQSAGATGAAPTERLRRPRPCRRRQGQCRPPRRRRAAGRRRRGRWRCRDRRCRGRAATARRARSPWRRRSSASAPPKPAVNSENSVEPMPMMTASTSTLMPDEMTLPSTRSAMKADLPNRPKGISTKPASVVSLNSISVTKSWTARMKKASSTSAQAKNRQAIWMKFSKKRPVAHQVGDRIRAAAARHRGRSARPCRGAGDRRSVKPVPDAFRPRPAKLSKTMRARLFQLPMM